MKDPEPVVHDLDLRGMEPPEPLEKVLDALEHLPPGEQLRLVIEREPRPLYRILANNGFAYRTSTLPGFLYEVRVWHLQAPDT